jgi:nitroreductase
MEAMDALFTRRSIRKYDSRPVPDDIVENILRAAMSAPSAGNQQPWHFVVIRDRAILEQIPQFHPHSSMCPRAALAVLVCADLHLETHQGYWQQDCAAAAENLLLAAHALGLGAVWLGVHPREERISGIRGLLGIPENVVPMALIPMGYPAEQKKREDRYRPDRVHLNKW